MLRAEGKLQVGNTNLMSCDPFAYLGDMAIICLLLQLFLLHLVWRARRCVLALFAVDCCAILGEHVAIEQRVLVGLED